MQFQDMLRRKHCLPQRHLNPCGKKDVPYTQGGCVRASIHVHDQQCLRRKNIISESLVSLTPNSLQPVIHQELEWKTIFMVGISKHEASILSSRSFKIYHWVKVGYPRVQSAYTTTLWPLQIDETELLLETYRLHRW